MPKSMYIPNMLTELSLIYCYLFMLSDQTAWINKARIIKPRPSLKSLSLCSSFFLKVSEQTEYLAEVMDFCYFDETLKKLLASALYLGIIIAISFFASESGLL